MTAQRRIRKNQHKRSNTDVDPYTERYRKASDGAKEARARAGGGARSATGSPGVEAGRGLAVEIGKGARIAGISLVPLGEGPGYILEVGDGEGGLDTGKLNAAIDISLGREVTAEEAVRAQAAPDSASSGQRGASGTASSAPAGRAFFEELKDVDELAEAANSGSQDILLAVLAAKEHAETEYKRRHTVFFEAEVNSLPTHVGSAQCYCEKAANHWHELGEI